MPCFDLLDLNEAGEDIAAAVARAVPSRLHPYDRIHPDDLLPATFSFRYLEDETVHPLGEVSVRVLHLPGHTPGMSTCWWTTGIC